MKPCVMLAASVLLVSLCGAARGGSQPPSNGTAPKPQPSASPSPSPPPPPSGPQPAPALEPPRRLTIVGESGAWERAVRDVYGAAFAAGTGAPVSVGEWRGGVDALRANAAAWDLVQIAPSDLIAACEEGLVEKLDIGAIGGRDHYLPQAIYECGVGAAAEATALAWDKEKIGITPSWSDFFDIAKFPGKRGLARGPRGALEVALLADGVAAGDVYRTLRTQDGVDRAFRKLDQIRPYVEWWDDADEAVRMLQTGEVLMEAAPSGRVSEAARRGHRDFGLQWQGALTTIAWWAVVRDSPNERLAMQFLYLAGVPSIEAHVLASTGLAGLAKGATEFAPPEAQAASVFLPANASGTLATDETFWHENQEKLGARFAGWLDSH